MPTQCLKPRPGRKRGRCWQASGKGGRASPDLPPDIAFEAVADEVFSYYRRHWKPRTLAVNLNYYKNNIPAMVQGAADRRYYAA